MHLIAICCTEILKKQFWTGIREVFTTFANRKCDNCIYQRLYDTPVNVSASDHPDSQRHIGEQPWRVAHVWRRDGNQTHGIFWDTLSKAFADWVPLAYFVWNVALVYRAPLMLYRALGAGSWARAHCHAYNTAREYKLDAIALMQLIVLTLSLTSTLNTWVSLIRYRVSVSQSVSQSVMANRCTNHPTPHKERKQTLFGSSIGDIAALFLIKYEQR